MTDAEFWESSRRKLYGLMIGNNANEGAKTDYDDMSEALGGDD